MCIKGRQCVLPTAVTSLHGVQAWRQYIVERAKLKLVDRGERNAANSSIVSAVSYEKQRGGGGVATFILLWSARGDISRTEAAARPEAEALVAVPTSVKHVGMLFGFHAPAASYSVATGTSNHGATFFIGTREKA